MTAASAEKIAYSRTEAAEVTGYSWDIITAAIRSGDLRETFPEVNGKRLKRGRILRVDLETWMASGRH